MSFFSHRSLASDCLVRFGGAQFWWSDFSKPVQVSTLLLNVFCWEARDVARRLSLGEEIVSAWGREILQVKQVLESRYLFTCLVHPVFASCLWVNDLMPQVRSIAAPCCCRTASRKLKAGETGLGRQVYFPGCQDLAAKKLLKSSYQVLSLMEGVFSNIYFDFSFFLSAARCSNVSSWNSRHSAPASETPWYCALVEIACEEDLPKLWIYCRRLQTKSYIAKLCTAKHRVHLVLIRRWKNLSRLTGMYRLGFMQLFTWPGTTPKAKAVV